MNYNGIKVASVLQIQETPNVTKNSPYISKGNYNSVLKICTYYQVQFQRTKSQTSRSVLSTYSIYKNMGLVELQCIKNDFEAQTVCKQPLTRHQQTCYLIV